MDGKVIKELNVVTKDVILDEWDNIDFEKKVLYVKQTICYFSRDGSKLKAGHSFKR